MWVFGYGSLIWRPAIPFDRSEVADLRGLARRFWQGSTDHRGVVGAPGCVLTLVEADEVCRGVAYHIPDGLQLDVLKTLDHREKGGYDRREVRLQTLCGESIVADVYLATPENENWLGPASVEEIAARVVKSSGPSGPNDEYVLKLEEALIEMDGLDQHVGEVATAVRRLR